MARLALRLNLTVKDDEEKWITINGTHVPVGEGGKIEGGPPALKQASAEAKGSQSSQPAQSKTNAKSNIDSLTKKGRKKAHEMSNAIASGRAAISESGMKAHVPGTAEYRRHAAEMEQKGLKASTFDGDYHEYIPEIKEALRKRDAQYVTLKNGDVHAKIDIGRSLGTTHGKDGKSAHKTTVVTAVHSEKRNDWHFYPDDFDD